MEDQNNIEARRKKAMEEFDSFRATLNQLWDDYESVETRDNAYRAGNIYSETSRDIQGRFDLPRYDEVDVQVEVNAAVEAGFRAKKRQHVNRPDLESLHDQYRDSQLSGEDYKTARLEMWNNGNLTTEDSDE
jgi:hypothetical protein